MPEIDISRNWAVLAPGDPASTFAAKEIVRIFARLRPDAGIFPVMAPVFDAAGNVPEDDRPVIVLNAGDDPEGRTNGFSWRAGPERVEIIGVSGRGLLNGVFSFLAALGMGWPEPGVELCAPQGKAPFFSLQSRGEYRRSVSDPAGTKRIAVSGSLEYARQRELLLFAVRSLCDAVILPLAEKTPLFW
jgi:hypothetical protein